MLPRRLGRTPARWLVAAGALAVAGAARAQPAPAPPGSAPEANAPPPAETAEPQAPPATGSPPNEPASPPPPHPMPPRDPPRGWAPYPYPPPGYRPPYPPPPGYGYPPYYPPWGYPPPPMIPPRFVPYREGEPPPEGYRLGERVHRGYAIGGGVTFGSLYLLTAGVASVFLANGDSDKGMATLFIPVVGPFVAMGTLDTSTAVTAALAVDGIAQGLGLGMLIAALLHPEPVWIRDKTARLTLVPAAGSSALAGLGVLGQW